MEGRGGCVTTGVTCYFPTGNQNDEASVQRWLVSGERLLRLPLPLIVFVSRDVAEAVRATRHAAGLEALTRIVPMALEDVRMARWSETIDRNREAYWPTRDRRASRDVHVVNTSKFEFVRLAAHMNPFQTSHFAFLDFNMLAKRPHGSDAYTNDAVYGKLEAIFRAPRPGWAVLVLQHWHPAAYDDLREFFARYRFQVCGLFWTVEGRVAERLLTAATEHAEAFIRAGYGHGEEHALARTVDAMPDDFSLSAGDYQDAVENYYAPTANDGYVSWVLQAFEQAGGPRWEKLRRYASAASPPGDRPFEASTGESG
jgi:hypothetical protein